MQLGSLMWDRCISSVTMTPTLFMFTLVLTDSLDILSTHSAFSKLHVSGFPSMVLGPAELWSPGDTSPMHTPGLPSRPLEPDIPGWSLIGHVRWNTASSLTPTHLRTTILTCHTAPLNTNTPKRNSHFPFKNLQNLKPFIWSEFITKSQWTHDFIRTPEKSTSCFQHKAAEQGVVSRQAGLHCSLGLLRSTSQCWFVPAPPPDPASCLCNLGRWEMLVQVLGSFPPMQKTWMEFKAPGFDLVQLLLLLSFGEWISRRRSLSVFGLLTRALSLSAFQIHKWNRKRVTFHLNICVQWWLPNTRYMARIPWVSDADILSPTQEIQCTVWHAYATEFLKNAFSINLQQKRIHFQCGILIWNHLFFNYLFPSIPTNFNLCLAHSLDSNVLHRHFKITWCLNYSVSQQLRSNCFLSSQIFQWFWL